MRLFAHRRESADATTPGSIAYFIDQTYGNKDGKLTPDELVRFADHLGHDWAWRSTIKEIAGHFGLVTVESDAGVKVLMAGAEAAIGGLRVRVVVDQPRQTRSAQVNMPRVPPSPPPPPPGPATARAVANTAPPRAAAGGSSRPPPVAPKPAGGGGFAPPWRSGATAPGFVLVRPANAKASARDDLPAPPPRPTQSAKKSAAKKPPPKA